MKIPLGEFELHVKPEPLERGLTIFERGQVESIRNLGKGAVEAVVHDGGAVWHPQLTILNDIATDAQCACGEAPDGICRHGAALIFALQSGDFPEGIATRSGKPPKEKAPAKGRGRPKLDDDAPKAKKAPAPKKAKPPKTPADIVAMVPHDELKAFVLQQCQQDKAFAIRLKAHFGDLMPAASPAEIKKRIQEMIQAAVVAKGKTKKLNQQQFSERAQEWLKEGERFAEAQEYLLSFAVANHLFAESADLLRYAHFPVEPIQLVINQAKELMLRLAGHPLPEPIRQEFLKTAHADWEKHYHSISPAILLASKICKDGPEYDGIEKMLATVLRNYNEAHVLHHWAMVKRVKGVQAGKDFQKTHAETAFFIRMEVETALSAKRYDDAIKAARKGQARFNAYLADRVTWIECLDLLFEAKGDTEARIQLAVEAYRNQATTDKVSLKNIAALGGKARWIVERKNLADPIAVKQSPDPYSFRELFALDDDWDGMIEFLRRYKVQRILLLGKALVKMAPEKYAPFLQTQLKEALSSKSRITEWEIKEVAITMAQCIGKDDTMAFFKDLQLALPKSLVLESFMKTIERNLTYYAFSYGF
ncbi:MAG TPA: hypothetical protein VHS96_00135 [Bacteroidia bacterium]|nr:hypothetical protein [Bacteroidia bacterium]